MKCNQEGCEHEAIFEMVWTKHQQYCPEHALKMINIGDAMGYPTPRHTIRVLPEALTPENHSQLMETMGRMLLSGKLTEDED